jgi:glutamyl-tRNA synthetase
MEDLIEKFSLDKLSSSPAAVNFSKLDHFNGIYIRELPSQELKRRILPFLQEAGYRVEDETLESIIPLIRERIHTLDEAVEMAGFFFQETIHPDPSLLIGKDMTASQSAFAAQRVYEVIEALPSMECDSLENELRNLADELNLKASQLFGILRIAVTGQSVSPPLIESMEVIGKSKVLERIQEAIALLSAQSDTK